MSGFSKQERLLKRAEFLRLSAQGQKVHTTNFVVLWSDYSNLNARIGITISRKVGNSVMRNWLKRLIREFYRHNKNLFCPVDYNIIAKKGAARLVFSELSQELGRALQRHQKQQC